MALSLRRVLAISRPRFWMYLLGPFLLGAAAAGLPSGADRAALAVGALFFLLPANLLIYGVNDIFDYDTDRRNPKKAGYEALVDPSQHAALWQAVAWAVGPFVLLALWPLTDASSLPLSYAAMLASLAAFFFLGVFYSAPPIRAKARPLLDSLFNALYVCPALVGFFLLGGSVPHIPAILAGVLWCMAMHAYSAVPDIAADRAAGVRTIATWLGQTPTLLLCVALYAAAAVLAAGAVGLWVLALEAVYLALMAASLAQTTPEGVFAVYRWFPAVNMAAGAALFLAVALR